MRPRRTARDVERQQQRAGRHTIVPGDPSRAGNFHQLGGALVPTRRERADRKSRSTSPASAPFPQPFRPARLFASTTLANLPAPVQTTTVTIGGATATIDFIAFLPAWWSYPD